MYSSNNLIKKPNSKLFGAFMMLVAFISSGCNNTTTSKYKIDVINGTGGGNFNAGERVTITATTPSDKQFNYWELDGKNVSTDNPYTFTVTQNASYTAIFKNQQVTVSVLNGTGGGTFDKGSSVTITATVPEGEEFSYWAKNGEKVSTDNPYTFTANESATYTAIYKTKVNIEVINGTGGGKYVAGEKVTITATIPEGEEFDYWAKNGEKVSTDNPYTFTANESATYTAIYKAKANIEVINGTGGGTYKIGSSITITANAAPEEQTFDYWDCDGEKASTDNPYTFTVTKDAKYTAKYKSMYRGVKRTGATPIEIKPICVKNGGTLTIDYRYIDPTTDKDKGVCIYLGTDTTNCFGKFKILPTKLDETYTGVTFSTLEDGYNRMVIDISQITSIIPQSCTAPLNITNVLFKYFEPTKGVYFDIASEPGRTSSRGALYKNASSAINFLKPYTVSSGGTIVVDYKFLDPLTDKENGVSLFFGSDDTNRFGNYKIYRYNMETTYNGITFTTLDDGYYRITIDISKLDKVRSEETAPTTISQISFKWFEASQGVYFDINPQDRTTKTTEFKMSDSEFVICNFTDIHVDSEDLLKDTGTVGKTIKHGIETSNPDILVFSGDIAGSAKDLPYIFNYLDGFGIPYFVILGNHDHEGNLGYEVIYTHIIQTEYGYIERGPDDLGSQGNYTIKIKNSSDKLVHSLIMMDTGNKYTITDDKNVEYFTGTKVSGVKYGTFNDKLTYCDGTSGAGNAWDGIRGDQVTWYEETATKLGCETTLICHAGFNEYVKAFEQYQDAVNKKDQAAIDKCAPIGKCTMGEQCCGTVEKTGLFDKIKSCGTKNVICGHDHLNDFSLLYEGVRLTYALKTGEGSYWLKSGERNGYTELKIADDGTTTLDQKYFNPLSE